MGTLEGIRHERERRHLDFGAGDVGRGTTNADRGHDASALFHSSHSPSDTNVSTTISISTQQPNGICATPNELRACVPRSPKTSRNNSEAPLATTCGSVKSGVLFTSTTSFTMRVILFRS